MVAPKRKRAGRPVEKGGKVVDATFLLDDAGGDFMDEFAPEVPRQPEPVQEQAASASPEREPTLTVVEEAEPAPTEPLPVEPTGSQPTRKRKRAKVARTKDGRPPRVDIGKRPEFKRAYVRLVQHAVANSREPAINNSDVVNAATCAVARAVALVDYARIQPRGQYSSPGAKALHDALEDAYFRALGEFFVERHADQLTDRALRTCYERYRQRISVDDEDDGLPNLDN